VKFVAVMRLWDKSGGFLADPYPGEWLAPRTVSVELGPTEVVIDEIHNPRHSRWTDPDPIAPSRWTWTYPEIRCVEAVTTSRLLTLGTGGDAPNAVRLDVGGVEPCPVVFTDYVDLVLQEFEGHGVPVDREPKRIRTFSL
jgi:hypothetical protein